MLTGEINFNSAFNLVGVINGFFNKAMLIVSRSLAEINKLCKKLLFLINLFKIFKLYFPGHPSKVSERLWDKQN